MYFFYKNTFTYNCLTSKVTKIFYNSFLYALQFLQTCLKLANDSN